MINFIKSFLEKSKPAESDPVLTKIFKAQRRGKNTISINANINRDSIEALDRNVYTMSDAYLTIEGMEIDISWE